MVDTSNKENINKAEDLEKNSEEKFSDAQTQKTEIGGPKGPEPTRYGDWEVAGRCSDF